MRMNSEMKNIRVNYMKEPVTDSLHTQYYLKFTTCQAVRLCALLYSDFCFEIQSSYQVHLKICNFAIMKWPV